MHKECADEVIAWIEVTKSECPGMHEYAGRILTVLTVWLRDQAPGANPSDNLKALALVNQGQRLLAAEHRIAELERKQEEVLQVVEQVKCRQCPAYVKPEG